MLWHPLGRSPSAVYHDLLYTPGINEAISSLRLLSVGVTCRATCGAANMDFL